MFLRLAVLVALFILHAAPLTSQNQLSLSLTASFLGAGGDSRQASTGLVAQLRVDTPGVEVRRTKTETWLPVRIESLIGSGDSIRTTDKGRALLAFFDGVLITTIQTSSEVTLTDFSGTQEVFVAEIAVARGFTDFVTKRTLNENAVFRVILPPFQILISAGGARTRVETNGRAATLNVLNGTVKALWKDGTSSMLNLNTGVRLSSDQTIGEVVPAVSFPTLDSALDGCPSQTAIEGDVQLNVRTGAGLDFNRIGGIDGKSAIQAMGVNTTGDWARIRFRDGFGWVNVEKLPLAGNCAGLRRFPDGFAEAGATRLTPAVPAATPTTVATPKR